MQGYARAIRALCVEFLTMSTKTSHAVAEGEAPKTPKIWRLYKPRWKSRVSGWFMVQELRDVASSADQFPSGSLLNTELSPR